MMAVPEGWTVAPGDDPATVRFDGPGRQAMLVLSVPSGLPLDAVTALVIANIKGQGGGDPEQTEAITMDGVPARLLTYHFASDGVNVHELDAHTVNNGRLYELCFANVAGSESADRTFVLDLLASFKFM